MFKTLTLLAALITLTLPSAHATADKQSFMGGGIGFEVLSQNGSGTGFYMQALGGYHFTSLLGVGFHAGFSNIGTVAVSAFDFGGFLEFTDSSSGLYGRFYTDGLIASTKGSGLMHGIDGSQLGFTFGVGAGILIPATGAFHLAPEITYRAAFMHETVNLIAGTFNVIWDF